jgi:hypothetical protein
MTAIPFPLRSNPGAVRFLGESRLVNCYPEQIGPDNRVQVSLLSIPGQTVFSSVTDISSRGAIFVEELDATYSVHGSRVFKLTDAGVATALDGTVAGSKPVIIERGPERFMSNTVTISIATPGVVSWTNHRLSAGTPVQFITDGTLPTGLVSGTTYYVLAAGLTPNSFRVGATAGGTAIDTSGSQTGTHTATRTEATYQVVIVSDLATFCIEDDQIIFVNLPEPANSVTFLDNRFDFGTPSGRHYWSDLNDALNTSGLSYATAEARPDGLVRAFASRGELWLLGTRTTEIWTGTGDGDLPFQPLGGTFIDKGCASKMSVVDFDNAVHWLGHDGIVYRGAGYNAARVSTHSVERAIETVTDKTTIKAYVDAAKGHTFLVLTCDDWTWVLDAATGNWHERKSYQRNDWRAWPYVKAWGKRLVGDKASGALLELSDDVLSENGRPIRASLILPDIPGMMIFDALEIDLATGVGLNVVSTANGYDPKVMLRWSDDGGYTWSNERTKSIGRQGQWDKRVCFTRMGTARTIRGRRYEIAISDNVLKSFALGDIRAEKVAG